MSLEEIREAIIAGQVKVVPGLIQAELSQGVATEKILNEAMIGAMRYVGEQFECGEFYVPEMLIAARAMQAGLAVVKPLLTQKDGRAAGRIIIGTVQGDLHDIGKNLVSMMIEGAGLELIDLGVDVPPQQFVAAVDSSVNVIAMSALLTTTMPRMKDVIDALSRAGVRHQVKVIVGGAPVTQEFADAIGADGYAPDASAAARLTQQLLSKVDGKGRDGSALE